MLSSSSTRPANGISGGVRFLWVAALSTAFMFMTAAGLYAQSNDDCLMCHDDPFEEASAALDTTISTFQDAELLSEIAHSDFDCIDCHESLADVEDPEDVHDTPDPVDCGGCHVRQARSHRRSLHGQAAERGDELAPKCKDCHGTHDILPSSDPRSAITATNIPLLCGKCHHEGTEVSLTHEIHQDHILSNYSQSIHGVGLFKQGLKVTAVCTSCHTSHDILPHTDPRSSIHRDNVARTCSNCHSSIERVHRKIIEGRLWKEDPNRIPACVDCHSPHEIRNVYYPAGQANKDCLKCHGDKNLGSDSSGEFRSLYVDEEAYLASTHGNTACAQCHTEVSPLSEERGCETIKSKVDCAICHASEVQEFKHSVHGTLLAEGDPDAPSCLDCHDKHATLSRTFPSSPTFARNVPDLCAKCHREGAKAAIRIDELNGKAMNIVESYTDSIHGKGLLQSGLLVTPTCADCHGAHSEKPPEDPESSVNSANVAGTCGKCHFGIEEVFKTSIHWPRVGDSEKDLPTCERCHTSHKISRTDLADFRLRMMNQCGQCHEQEAKTFFDTFHGKVSRLGASRVAKCHDCHGTHNILPPTDPASTLSRDNVVSTCAKCHPGAHRRFAGYLTHSTHHDVKKYPWIYWSFWGMTALLVGTLTFFVFHTVAWLIRLWISREEWRVHKAAVAAPATKLYKRFSSTQRVLHITMMISFFTLALTGMTLKFSYAVWAQWISWALGGFETMGVLHRLGGITLFIVIAVHLRDVFRFKRESRQTLWQIITGPNSILFNRRDILEFRDSIKWFFGLGDRPRYGRYTYWEKFDYFAVFWGVIVIGATGWILWFPEFFTYFLPGKAVNVATIIHSDEALLAVGFIFTIHFFNTHFRPDKFPIDPVIFTGRVALDEFQYDKPREYEELVESGQLEQHLADAYPENVERGFKTFGFIALAIGLMLIGLIIYAVLFGYR